MSSGAGGWLRGCVSASESSKQESNQVKGSGCEPGSKQCKTRFDESGLIGSDEDESRSERKGGRPGDKQSIATA